jgi:hypothetical protein
MFKFQFTRTEAPMKPSWNCKDLTWERPKKMNPLLEPIGMHVWNWMCGKEIELKEIDLTSEMLKGLDDTEEDMRQYYNYSIAQSSKFNVLFERLNHEEPQFALNAAYALVSSGVHAVDGLIELLDEESLNIQYLVCFILSEIGPPAKDAVGPLLKLLSKT